MIYNLISQFEDCNNSYYDEFDVTVGYLAKVRDYNALISVTLHVYEVTPLGFFVGMVDITVSYYHPWFSSFSS